MAHLNKQDFDENVHIYVDKTKTEILNSFSQVLENNDELRKRIQKYESELMAYAEKVDLLTADLAKDDKIIGEMTESYSCLQEDFQNIETNYNNCKYDIRVTNFSIILNIVFSFIIVIFLIIHFYG